MGGSPKRAGNRNFEISPRKVLLISSKVRLIFCLIFDLRFEPSVEFVAKCYFDFEL